MSESSWKENPPPAPSDVKAPDVVYPPLVTEEQRGTQREHGGLFAALGAVLREHSGLFATLGAVLFILPALMVVLWPKPQCSHASVWLGPIVTQEQQGNWAVAASNADTAALTPALCRADQRTLVERAVADGLEALFVQRFDPTDVTAQQQGIDQW